MEPSKFYRRANLLIGCDADTKARDIHILKRQDKVRWRRLAPKSKPRIQPCMRIFKSDNGIKSSLVPLRLSKASYRDRARGRLTNFRRNDSTSPSL